MSRNIALAWIIAGFIITISGFYWLNLEYLNYQDLKQENNSLTNKILQIQNALPPTFNSTAQNNFTNQFKELISQTELELIGIDLESQTKEENYLLSGKYLNFLDFLRQAQTINPQKISKLAITKQANDLSIEISLLTISENIYEN